MKRKMKRKNQGFTLAELLIVIAIVAVLTAISIPIYFKQLERSKQAVDLANMRSAYAAATIKWMTYGDGKEAIYYFNGVDVVETNDGLRGYGKSSVDASEFSKNLQFSASGIPNRNGNASYIIIKMNEAGVERMLWGGAYSGKNVTSPEEYQTLSDQDKLKRDILLVDSLQDEFRNMTYGDLKKLFISSDGTINGGMKDGTIDGYLCITIAYSTLSHDGVVSLGDTKTNIYLKEIFDNTGFNTDLENNETYIINSVPDTTNRIWVNLRISKSKLQNLNENSPEWNMKASKAYTYVKSGGATTPEELREINRKKS